MRVNPVLRQELRTYLRGPRPGVVVSVYALVLVGMLWMVWHGATAGASSSEVAPLTPAQVANSGRGAFEWVLLTMLLLVLVITPGMVAGAIAGERERGALLPLQATRLGPYGIVLGKLGGAVAFVALLVVVGAPVVGVTVSMGGVTRADVVRGVGAVAGVGVLVAVVTVMCSAVVRRTQTAALLAYAAVVLVSGGTLFAWLALGGGLDGRAANRPNPGILWANPAVLTAAAVGEPGQVATDQPATESPLRGLRAAMAGTVAPTTLAPTSTSTTRADPNGDPRFRGRFGPGIEVGGALPTLAPTTVAARMVPLDTVALDDNLRAGAVLWLLVGALAIPCAAVRLRVPAARIDR